MTPDKVEEALGVVSAIVDKTNWQPDIDAGTEALSVLTEALAEMERDAARYRWLRDFSHPDADSSGVAVTEQWFTDWGRPYTHHFSGDQLDAAIDTAMKETP